MHFGGINWLAARIFIEVFKFVVVPEKDFIITNIIPPILLSLLTKHELFQYCFIIHPHVNFMEIDFRAVTHGQTDGEIW
jgi:hypothetical protein